MFLMAKNQNIYPNDIIFVKQTNALNLPKDETEFLVEGEIKIEELNVRGFYDIVAKKGVDKQQIYLYDIKTCGGWSWKMKFGRKKRSRSEKAEISVESAGRTDRGIET